MEAPKAHWALTIFVFCGYRPRIEFATTGEELRDRETSPSDRSRVADVVLALGLVLTSATQLRVVGSPIGPGELLLLYWLVITIGKIGISGGFVATRPFGRLLSFWLLFAASLCLGTIVAIATNEALDAQWFLHDVMAYPLVGAVSCLVVVGQNPEANLDRVCWLFAAIGSSSLAILIAGGQGLVPLPVDPWFWERFRGWSQNPNQLSELCGTLAFVCIHLFDTSRRVRGQMTALLCLAISVYAGVLTQSDTFRYALLVAVPIFLFLRVRSRVNIDWISALAVFMMAGAFLAITQIVPLPQLSVAGHAADIVAVFSKGGGKEASHEAELRASLWAQAIHRGVFDSWLLGLGPGPHLVIPAEIVDAHSKSTGQDAPGNTVHPQANGTANFEAHNTLLDLFTQGGLLAAGSFVWILASAGWRALICGRSGLIALLIGSCVVIFTGNAVRTPSLWFGLALCLAAERGVALQIGASRSSATWNLPREAGRSASVSG